MLFHRSKEGIVNPSSPINKSKWILGLVGLLLLISIIGYASFSLKLFADKVIANWDNLKFTWEKPNIVQATRIRYASESAKLEESFSNKEPSAEDKLLDEVTNQLKSGKE